jgi:uncharacterized protein
MLAGFSGAPHGAEKLPGMIPGINPRVLQTLAAELAARPAQVQAAVELLDGGATVPFIARYRKEATGELDDTRLRLLEERLAYLRELEARREQVLSSIEGQGKLDAALRASIEAAESKQALEDLYLPYRPKRRSKAQIAREAGLEGLADALWNDPGLDPQQTAGAYVRPQADAPERVVADAAAALDGARQILMERMAEDAALVASLRGHLKDQAQLVSSVVPGREGEGAKFRDWFDHREPLAKIPSHRALALLRGRKEEVLRLALRLPEELLDPPQASPCIGRVAAHFGLRDQGRPADRWLLDCARWTWSVKLSLHLELELMETLRQQAEEEAIRVFARNLRDLLLAAPAGAQVTLGLDPGIRTGVKVAVVDATGKLLDTATLYPHEPRRDREGFLAALRLLAQRHAVRLVAIGNGTASRETDQLVAELMRRHPELTLRRVSVSEAGASVYSASELAAREFPDLDVTLRGAVSIARRLQDPLAELVKIDPRSIGVGQYQHDVGAGRLARSLDAVVEDCVNAVGVDVNTASASLLARVSGLNAGLAAGIVAHRDRNGPFSSRQRLRDVPRLGDKTFEQSAGFLRIGVLGRGPGADAADATALDASGVHPEAYPVVERMLADLGKGLAAVMGNAGALRGIDPARYVDARFGLPTVRDILRELEKPGRDPRPEFRSADFREDVHEVRDLQPGMLLEGVVSNVTNFGAFVDIGVHQDGLVHVSALSHRFVSDPHTVVKAGEVVKVKVLSVDLERRRIALTLRLDDPLPEPGADTGSGGRGQRPARAATQSSRREAPAAGAMAAAFARLKPGA